MFLPCSRWPLHSQQCIVHPFEFRIHPRLLFYTCYFLLYAAQVGKLQFCVYYLLISYRIDCAFFTQYVVIFKAADYVHDCVYLADIA